MSESFVKNAADPIQVKTASQKTRNLELRETGDVLSVMSTKEGRRFMWRMLSECKIHESIWHPSAMIHYNSGRQDVGHWLEAQIIKADQNLYLIMQKEAMEASNG